MIKIYGGSDDLIEIDGDISDEIGVYFLNKTKIGITASDGTKGKIHYDNEGQWRIEVLSKGDKFREKISSVGDDSKHIGDNSECSPYSDILILEDGIEWIKIGRKTFKK